MADQMMRALGKDKKLFNEFKQDPIKTIAKLESQLGVKFNRVNIGDLSVLQSLSENELDMLIALSTRAQGLGVKGFKI